MEGLIMSEMDKYYQILGLNPRASEKEIVEAYKVLIKVWDPDRFLNDPNMQKIANEKTKEIDEAYKRILIFIGGNYQQKEKIPETRSDVKNEVLDIIVELSTAFKGDSRLMEAEAQIASEGKKYDSPTPSLHKPLYKPPQVQGDANLIPKFLSANSIARWTTIFLVISIILAPVSIWSTFIQVDLLARVMDGQIITALEAASSDSRQQIIALLKWMTSALITTLFFCWIYRAYKNLSALGARNLKYTPGWAVGFFFIPILNLYRPFQVMREILKASDPQKPYTASLIGWWWAITLIEFMLLVQCQSAFTSERVNILYFGNWVYIIYDFVSIILAIITIFVIGEVEKRQEDRVKVITHNSTYAP